MAWGLPSLLRSVANSKTLPFISMQLGGIETDSSSWNSTCRFKHTIVLSACMVFLARKNYHGPYFTPTRTKILPFKSVLRACSGSFKLNRLKHASLSLMSRWKPLVSFIWGQLQKYCWHSSVDISSPGSIICTIRSAPTSLALGKLHKPYSTLFLCVNF